ncbi:hypothetical protein [Symmachiella macrocystis]|nr:hypothetical protein [Symmachiella macrocystis]
MCVNNPFRVTLAESGCAVELLTKISRVSTLMKTSTTAGETAGTS